MVKCRGIVAIAHGFNHIDLDTASEMGIPVSNLYFCHREVANHTIMFLLAATRKLIMLHNLLKEGKWRRDLQPPVAPLYGETIGIIGFGHIGQEVAKRARALEMQIVASDPVARPERAAELGVELVALDDLLTQSDYVTLHCPSNAHTRQTINERTLGLMKPSASGSSDRSCSRSSIGTAIISAPTSARAARSSSRVSSVSPRASRPRTTVRAMGGHSVDAEGAGV
jgi:phosphoglycerate dehydrogenase-like enzyme